MNDVYFQHEQRSDMNNKRNAGMSKGEIMNRLATSKEDILAASRELIKENGWAAVSIRSVAAKCSVSAGTIYNYYESKAELLGATIESVWQEIFFHPEDEQVFHDVTTCISWIYERFKYFLLRGFRTFLCEGRIQFPVLLWIREGLLVLFQNAGY